MQERDITASEVKIAFDEGRIVEVMGAGTAATCLPVANMEIDGKTYSTGATIDGGWDHTKELLDTLNGIYYGSLEHKFAHIVEDRRI